MLMEGMLGIHKFFGYRLGGTRDRSDVSSEQIVPGINGHGTIRQDTSYSAAGIESPASDSIQQQYANAALLQGTYDPQGTTNGLLAQSVPHSNRGQTHCCTDNQDTGSCCMGDEPSSSTVSNVASPGCTQSRRQSLLSDAGRASRCSSFRRESFPDSPASAVPQEHQQPNTLHQLQLLQQQHNLGVPNMQQADAEPFWASSWSFGHHSDQNQRQYMEDRISCQDLSSNAAFSGCKRAGFFAVYDGHAGHEAAEYLENHLLSYVLNANQEDLRNHPLAALSAAVNRAEQEITSRFMAARCNAGSTLLALLLVDDKLHIANVGDSRAVLVKGTEAQQLTRDHKPACSVEQQRIEADDPAAEITCDGYMYGELAVARAIGSAHLKRDPSKRALIPTPDLISVQLSKEDDFVVLATDGLWDKVDNAEMVRVARRTLATVGRDAVVASRALVDRALRCSSSDNISVITLLLHGRAFTLPRSNSMLFRRQALSGLNGADSPRSSTPCSGVNTPASTTPRPNTPCVPGQQAE